MASPSKQQKVDDNSNESVLLIWLDSYVDSSDENRNAQQRLLELNSNSKFFNLPDDCEQCIKNDSNASQIILIVSGGLGQSFVPRIIDEQRIVSIYVYCGNKAHHEIWTVNYSKIRLVTTKLFELIQAIKDNDFHPTKPIIEEPIEENEMNGAGGIYEFNNRHIIADLSLSYLLQMKREKTDKDDFVHLCQNKIGQDPIRNAILQEFQQIDTPEKVLVWFNHDTLFNLVLLQAFQYINIENMYACRYFIQDIQKYFNEHKHTESVQVFRCTMMSSDLLHELKSYEGKVIGIKSLLTTSCDRAMTLSCHSEGDLEKRVLFEIDADPKINGVKSFVKTSTSYQEGLQDAIVFMIGSLFKINQVVEEDDVTVFQMVLCADTSIDSLKTNLINENGEKDFIGFIQLQYDLSINLQYPDVLHNANKILENYLNKSTLNDIDRIRAYDLLGNIFVVKKQWDQSLNWYKQALILKEKNSLLDDTIRFNSYSNIASVYLNKNDYNQALNIFKQILTIFKQKHGEESPLLIQCYIKISEIYDYQEKFTDLLICYNQMFNILLKHFSIDDQRFAFLYNNMGKTFANLGQYSLALGYYQISLDIKLKYQFSKENIAINYKSIGIVHKAMGNNDQARHYFEQTIKIYDEFEPTDSNLISEIQNLIRNLSTS